MKGAATIRGLFSLPAAGTASASKAFDSQPTKITASVFNTGAGAAITQNFQWQAEPVGNNTATTSGTLNLLFGTGANKLAETGLNIASNGQITFATGQTFPGTGDGTVTSVGSGAGLAGGPITGSGTLSIATSGVTNAMLVNPSLTVTASSPLSGGGSVSLGGTTSLGLKSCAANQILQFVSGAWACGNAATGTVTSVGSGAGLTGGPITGSGTLSIATGGVSNAMLANSSLTVAAGTGLTGGGSVVLGGSTIPISVDTTKVPLLATANTFNGAQTVNGNLSATGPVTGSSFQIGSNLFAFGYANYQNAFLGFAGNNNATAGAGNTASGYEALYLNATGSNNTANGTYALSSNTGDSNGNGSQNTASGAAALFSNTTGNNNTASGYNALYNNRTGSYNTASGYQAIYYDYTGNSNTALGYSAGPDESVLNLGLSNTTTIGAFADVTASNALILGGIAGVNHCTTQNSCASISVGIGTTAPVATLDVRDNGSGGNTISATTSNTSESAVYGINNSTSGNANGASFYTASPQGTAVVGVNSATTGNHYAGYFEGNVYISGNVSKGGGSFKIDHPLDPANKYLYHSFVESPDMMNVYNGNVITNQRGLATVILPDYFEALNRDFRYQLTVIGQFAQAIVAKEISRNRFKIRTSKPGVKVSWQVTGVRHDAYANAHRIQVEEDKSPQEQGRYLHPELFGAPREQAIGYDAPRAATPGK